MSQSSTPIYSVASLQRYRNGLVSRHGYVHDQGVGLSWPSTPLQFSTEGWRANARELLQRTPGAVVLLVAADQSIHRKMLGVCPSQTLRDAKRPDIASVA